MLTDNFGTILRAGDLVAVVWGGGTLLPVLVTEVNKRTIRIRYPTAKALESWKTKTKLVYPSSGIVKISIKQAVNFTGHCDSDYVAELLKMRSRFITQMGA